MKRSIRKNNSWVRATDYGKLVEKEVGASDLVVELTRKGQASSVS